MASDKDKTVAPSESSSIGAHVSVVTETVIPSPRCVQGILASHPFNDSIWDRTDPYDVLVDTIKSVEDLAGAHFTDWDYENLTDQNYDNLREDLQSTAHKYDGGLKQLMFELASDIIIEEAEDRTH